MKFSLALFAPLAILATAQSTTETGSPSGSASAAQPSGSGSSDFGTGLISALNSAGLTSLATLIQPLASQLVPVLQAEPFTVFAPDNNALSAVTTTNQSAIAEILMYHVVYGQEAPSANNTVAATLLSAGGLLGPNITNQALVYNNNATSGFNIVEQAANVTANTTYQNLQVYVIDSVLEIPAPLPVELANPIGANVGTLVSALGAVAPQLLTTANTTAGLTIFAPNNAAVQAATPALASLAGSNSTAITQIVLSHVLPMVVYSTNITDGLTAATLDNNTLTLNVNSSGVFVTNNGVTATVLSTDYVAANGVAHVIDRVLFDTSSSSSNSTASASASATA